MKFWLNPNEEGILFKLPATLFSYRYSKTTGKVEFTSLNEGVVPLVVGNTAQTESQIFGLLELQHIEKLKKTIEEAEEKESNWSCSFSITLGNQVQWIEFSGRNLAINDQEISGYGFASLAGEKIRELEQSREQLASLNRLHDLIINFSTLLVQAKLEDVDQAVNTTLSRLGEYAEVDRVYIFEYMPADDTVNNTYEWCGEGISPEIDNLQGIPFEAIPRWKEKFSRNEYVYIPLVSEIAPEYHVEKEILEPQGIISLLTIPLYYGENFYGFIGFDSVKRQREWTVEHINLLRLAGDIIAGTLNRARFEREIIAARKEAEEANKAKSEFLATMSHEIRTPMNAILGFSEILHNSIDDPKNKQYISAILGSGRTLLALINDILDLSKIDSGQMHIFEEPVDVQSLVNEIVQLFLPKTAEKGIYLHAEVSENFPSVLITDEVRLRQVLFNIVGNAVKFTETGGILISLESSRPENTRLFDLTIKVHDTGVGIPKNKLQSIFQSFYQVESDTTRKYGGTGLGLSIARKLIHLMGGTIEVESEINRGSTFTLHLPSLEVADLQEPETDHHDWENEIVVFDKALMLIVDDVDYNRELIKKYFENDKIEILHAVNGNQGVEMCRQYKPDLVLMDLRMPEMNGYEATETIKNDPEIAHIPVIAFTASSMKHDEEKIHALFNGYIRKPVTRHEVVRAIKQFIPHHTADIGKVEVEPEKFSLKKEQIVQFLDAYESKLAVQQAQLRTFIDPEAADQFGRDLIFLVRQYGISPLLDLSTHMQQAIENFDFGQFEVRLNQIDKEILVLRNMIGKQA
ncbi:MAG: ATP-binding protein [Bacteroidia bacterium]|nr:ATP-binding protein [Bacteroidia bacterium]